MPSRDPEYNRKYYEAHKKELIEYQTKYVSEHKAEHNRYNRKCHAKHKSEYNKRNRLYSFQLKIESLTHYGNGKCACITCGEDRQQCLSIDHINGGGRIHREEIGKGGASFYLWLKRNNFPEGYQTLCMNCQFDKEYQRNKGKYEND